jgi:hypothetical protein
MSRAFKKRVIELLDYDPKTGIFINKTDRANQKAGALAGHVGPNGYRSIMIDYKAYYAHHLAVLIMTGAFPPKKTHVDHKNGNRDENWWENLRVTTFSINGHNRKNLNKNNSSGATGIYQVPSGKFSAKIWVDRSQIFLGTFDTFEAAYSVREAFKDARSLR